MMPEHDPQPARGSGPDGEGAGSDAHDDGDDSVVQMSAHRPPPASGGAPGNGDDTVVDLRRAEPAEVPQDARDEPAPVGIAVERRSPEVAAVAPPTVAPTMPTDADDAAPTVTPPRSALSQRVVRVAVPALVVLALAVLLAGVAVLRSGASTQRAQRWDRVEQAAADRADAVDAVWTATLASVAAGVGQSVESGDRLPDLVGAAGGDLGADPPGDDVRGEQIAADAARRSFLDDVDAASGRSQGSPVSLGNELSSLERSHAASVQASDELAAAAGAEGDSAREDAASARTLALVLLAVGLIASALVAELSRRRLRRGLDRPVGDLQRVIDRIGTTAPEPVTEAAGFAELTWLATDLRRHAASVRAQLGELRRRADWGDQSRRILEALELAEDEASSYSVLTRALTAVGGDRPAELLLAERGSTSLHVVAAGRGAPAPGCPVDSTVACVALRRGQVSVFDSSESINACPKLRDRPGGACSAACVPVTVAGRPVGVIHMTAPDGAPPTADVVEQLVSLATHTGTRFSALRTLESSRQEASTDGLTGLPNRRTLETQIGELFERDTPFVMVLADLDRFKLLNDNFGHEVGDRALQLFAGVLRDSVRANDVVARLGGEEFVLVYPNMSVEISVEAIDRVRTALARALEGTTLPSFTCSFGIAHSTVGHDGDAVLRVADAGLLQAKDLGGDQAVVADTALAATIFADDAPLRARREEHP